MAIARSIHHSDEFTASRLANDAIRQLVEAVRNGLEPDSPDLWAIVSDHVLGDVHRQAMTLFKRRNALCEQLATAQDAAARRKEANAAALALRLQSEVSAITLLDRLQWMNTVVLNQHTLRYDIDFDGLVGTNPYGIDFYAGRLTLENVTQWRTAMLKGKVWGASPVPEWEDSEDTDEDCEVRELHNAIEWIDAAYVRLASASWLYVAEQRIDCLAGLQCIRRDRIASNQRMVSGFQPVAGFHRKAAGA
jgi:hypothetical protein